VLAQSVNHVTLDTSPSPTKGLLRYSCKMKVQIK
jgi:hypothetical protein